MSALLLLFAVFGVALRLRQFLFNRSLWVDEIMLAHNLIHRDIGSLLTEPLTSNQSAAPGFLLAAWSAVTMFGADEYALRLVPLIAGLLVPLLAVVLARHELKSAVAQLAFVALVSFSPVLIFYASEIKQYSSDAFFALALLVSVAYRKSRYGTWLLAGTGLVALTSSLPALFVMAPAALLLLYEAISSSRWRQTVIVGVAWGLAAAIHAAYLLHAGVDRAFMVSWWAKYHGFAPFPPTSITKVLWYPQAFSSLTYLSFRDPDHAVPGFEAAWVDMPGWLLALTLAAALFAVIRSRQWTGVVAAGAIVTTLVASMVEIYPFSSRLLIFLVPLILFVIAVGIDELDRRSAPAAWIAAALLLAVVVPKGIAGAIEPRSDSDLRGALTVVNRGFEPGDAVAVIPLSGFEYYRDVVEKDDVPVFRLTRHTRAQSVIAFAQQNGARRLWFVAAHAVRHTRKLRDELAETFPVLSQWRTNGTVVMLLDFSQR